MSKKARVDLNLLKRMLEADDEEGRSNLTTDFDRLVKMGISLPRPESLEDDEVSRKLWQVIDGMAKLRTFLENTDHMSDRELYSYLWNHALREEVVDQIPDQNARVHLDPLGGCSEEDIENYLRYYADEAYRKMWAEDFPEDPVPAHEDPPHDRDRFLPQD